jgi:hypothetical protein
MTEFITVIIMPAQGESLELFSQCSLNKDKLQTMNIKLILPDCHRLGPFNYLCLPIKSGQF